MNVLLDTHALIWAALEPSQLSRTATKILRTEGRVLLVSSATAWEIATKVRLGKMPGAEELEKDLLSVTQRAGYTWVPISAEVALRSGRLPGKHGDPFDRMIAAQALALDVPVISNDGSLDGFGVRRIW